MRARTAPDLKRLDEQRHRVESKLDAIYGDRLEGRISPEMYDRKAVEIRAQAAELSRHINEIEASARAPVQDAINIMSLTSWAADLFLAQPAAEKQGFLRLVLKSACWQHGRLQTEFEEPFESLRRSNRVTLTKHEGNRVQSSAVENWLPGMDSNH